MKLGIISDVHSNIDALKKAFETFKEENVDKVICAGDVIGIGPYPEKCIDFLMKNKDKFITIIKGNHEGYLLKGLPIRNHNRKNGRILTIEERSMHSWNHNRLSDEQVSFIRNWKERDLLSIEGKKILIEHYPQKEDGKFKTFYAVPTYKQISKLCEDKDTDIFIFGHTHNAIYYNEGGKIFINPGSTGCPINTAGANLGILDVNDGIVKYKQFAPEYDVDNVINEIKELNYPISSLMIKLFYRR